LGEIASRYDFLILEDDPYYYLNYGAKKAPPLGQDHLYKRERAKSLWSLDEEGRVVRCESFSKVLSSGIRVGFVTGPDPILERLIFHSQVSVVQSSSLSQILVYRTLKLWGEEAWQQHLNNVALFYMRRRDQMVEYANKYLSNYVIFHPPTAGMFLWIKLNKVDDSFSLISQKAIEAKVVLVPGQAFRRSGKSPFVRAAFSTASLEQLEEALRRFGDLLHGYHSQKPVSSI